MASELASEDPVDVPSPSQPSEAVVHAVKCGAVTGDLYIEKLKGPGNMGSHKCILSNSAWYTPVEFEALGGKSKSKYWRRSIHCGNVQLGSFLGIGFNRSDSPTSRTPSSSWWYDSTTPSQLIDPVLAFIKTQG